MDVPRFNVFETRFNDDELENEFHSFFYKNNLTALFTNEHRASGITVTYIDAKSVVNKGGSYHKQLKKFSNILSMANDNKSYEEAIFRILYNSRTFQGFMSNIRKVSDYIKTIDPAFKFNTWNIVWYNEDLV